MAKFCSKCGMKLNEQTGKCPNCDEKTKMDTASSDSNISIRKPLAGNGLMYAHSDRHSHSRITRSQKRKQKENNSSNHNCYCCITDRYRRRYRCFHGT